MPSRSQLAVLLADRVDRLRGAFAALHRSVREKVAEIVGATVADVVRQTVRVALEPPTPPAPVAPVAPVARRNAYDPWGGPETDGWADDRDPINDDGSDAWGHPAPVRPTMSPAPPIPPEQQVLPRLAAAAVVGLKAAAWWLATNRLRRGWGCVVAGVLAGGAAYALGPVAVAVAPASTALSLAARSAELVNTLPV
jgi:hypothetical protein